MVDSMIEPAGWSQGRWGTFPMDAIEVDFCKEFLGPDGGVC